jgi:hypothetical protein
MQGWYGSKIAVGVPGDVCVMPDGDFRGRIQVDSHPRDGSPFEVRAGFFLRPALDLGAMRDLGMGLGRGNRRHPHRS